jgi:hypothetical protein
MEEEEDIPVIMDNSISRVEDTQKAGVFPLVQYSLILATQPALALIERVACQPGEGTEQDASEQKPRAPEEV